MDILTRVESGGGRKCVQAPVSYGWFGVIAKHFATLTPLAAGGPAEAPLSEPTRNGGDE